MEVKKEPLKDMQSRVGFYQEQHLAMEIVWRWRRV
jgi:hypothetical protein